MGRFQLGTQVIERNHRPIPALGRAVRRLGKQAGQGGQLGLAPRERLPGLLGGQSNAPIRPVGTYRGVAQRLVALTGHGQGVGKRQA